MYVFDMKPKDTKKTSIVPLKVSEKEKQRLHLAAMELNMTVSQLLREAVEFYLQDQL